MESLVIWSMLFLTPLAVCAKDENLLKIESWGNGVPELRISAPPGYTIEKHKGPDFDVHYINSKNPDDPSMGLYIGHHPNIRHSTCVILMQPQPDLRVQAIELMREWGPVHAGSPAGDFSVVTLTEYPGWVVTSHHRDILTYVAPQEMAADKGVDVAIGLFGRSKRDRDASELEVIHVEDKRNAA